jgi:molecular chaperone DnaK
MQYLLGRFLHDTGYDLSYDRSAVTRVRQESETAKIKLSAKAKVTIKIPNICIDDEGESLHLNYTLSRKQLEKMTLDLIDRSITTCERILSEAGSSRDDMDEILLVGGQSRMPLVRNKVGDFLGREPSDKVHPDEAVAIGAAIMAHSLVGKQTTNDMTLLDVLPMPIGINKVDGTMHILFPKNQPLPDYKTRTLTTSKDNQRSIMLRIYQGDSKHVRENELLGRFVFSGLRPGPKGSVRVEVTFHIDSEGILNLTARDLDTGQLVESQIKMDRDEEEAKPPAPKPTREEAAAPEAPVPGPLSMPQSALAASAVAKPDPELPATPTEEIGLLGTLFQWLGSFFRRD